MFVHHVWKQSWREVFYLPLNEQVERTFFKKASDAMNDQPGETKPSNFHITIVGANAKRVLIDAEVVGELQETDREAIWHAIQAFNFPNPHQKQDSPIACLRAVNCTVDVEEFLRSCIENRFLIVALFRRWEKHDDFHPDISSPRIYVVVNKRQGSRIRRWRLGQQVHFPVFIEEDTGPVIISNRPPEADEEE